MTIQDRAWWLENTAPGVVARAQGRDPFVVDRDQAEAIVAETRAHWRNNYGRELGQREIEIARQAAEQRSMGSDSSSPLPVSVPELVRAVNSRVVGAGWRYTPEFGPGQGIAMRQPDGSYTGDPDVVARAQAVDVAARARLAAISNIETLHVARPT